MRRTIFLCVMLLAATCGFSQSRTTDSYVVESGWLKEWTGDETTIDLTADEWLLYNVYNISSHAFSNSKVKNIVISSTVDGIDSYAFADCESLETVVFSEKGNEEDMTLYFYAFEDCKNLRSVKFSKYVTRLTNCVFRGCTSLTSFSVSGHDSWVSMDGIIYSKDRTQLILFPPGITGHHDLYYKVTTIASEAFCSSSLTSIDLTSDNLQVIGSYAFDGAASLEVVIFPQTLTTIEEDAFYKCVKLSTLILPNSLASIGHSAFYRCISLPEKVKIPANVSYVAGNAFARSSVKEFVVADGNYWYRPIDGVLYDGSGTTLVAWPYEKSKEDYEVPDGTTAIGDYAFYYADIKSIVLPSTLQSIGISGFKFSNLESVSLPEGVTTLGEAAFYKCPNLNEIEIPSTIGNFDNYTFRRDENNTSQRTVTCHAVSPVGEWKSTDVVNDVLYVPEEGLPLYKVSKGWRDFGTILPIPDTQYFTVDYESQGNGLLIVAVDGNEVESGCEAVGKSMVTVYAVAFSGSHLKSLTVNGKEVSSPYNFSLTENVTISAKFVADGGASVVAGDANEDGTVTMSDANLVVNYYVNEGSVALNADNADMNNDGNITMTDANAIVNVFVSAQ